MKTSKGLLKAGGVGGYQSYQQISFERKYSHQSLRGTVGEVCLGDRESRDAQQDASYVPTIGPQSKKRYRATWLDIAV